MDGSRGQFEVVQGWDDPRDARHPTQMLLRAETTVAIFAALRMARPGITRHYLRRAARELRSPSLHRFVDALIFYDESTAGFRSYHNTVRAALDNALAHQVTTDAADAAYRATQPQRQSRGVV